MPLLVRGPSIEAGSVCRVPVVGYDFLPTFYELAGGAGQLSGVVDGGSFASLLERPEAGPVKRAAGGIVFSRPRQGNAAIRDGEWKLLAEINSERQIQSVQLFKVSRDIAESKDLSSKRREKTKELRGHLEAFLESYEDSSPTMKKRGGA